MSKHNLSVRIERDGFVMCIVENEYGYNCTVYDPNGGLVDDYHLETTELVAKLVTVAIKSQSITAQEIEVTNSVN